MQYIQMDQTDWGEESDQSAVESLKSLLSLQTVDVCILWRDSIMAERRVKRWIFHYLGSDRQNPSTLTEILQGIGDSAKILAGRLAAR